VSLARPTSPANSRLLCSYRFSFTSPETLQRAILDCKNYFHICADFIDDYSILVSGWIDARVRSESLAFDENSEAPLISARVPIVG
jgi:hypothetical protein